jgi:hypothetical protein
VGHAATSMKHIPLKDVFALMKASEIFAFWGQVTPTKSQHLRAKSHWKNKWSLCSSGSVLQSTHSDPECKCHWRLIIISLVFSRSTIISHANTFNFGRHLLFHSFLKIGSAFTPSKRNW